MLIPRAEIVPAPAAEVTTDAKLVRNFQPLDSKPPHFMLHNNAPLINTSQTGECLEHLPSTGSFQAFANQKDAADLSLPAYACRRQR